MKNSSDTIGNQTRDNPACSGIPQPSTPPRVLHAPRLYKSAYKIVFLLSLRKKEGADMNDSTESFHEFNALLTCSRT